jgi:hypothetical protein
MSKENLSRLRIFVPGVMLLIVLALVVTPLLLAWYSADPQGMASLARSFSSIGPTIITAVLLGLGAYVLGSAYQILGIRQLLLRKSRQEIDSNIKDRLLAPYLQQEPISKAADNMRKDRSLLNVFYYFVDNKESLKERAKSVYLNGLLWSSVADAMAMALLLAAVSATFYLALWRVYYLIVAVVALTALMLLWRFVMPRVVAKHIALGDEQIGFILDLHEPELREKLEELAGAAKE